MTEDTSKPAEKTVLIVDDDPIVGRLLFRLLKPHFNQVFKAETPTEARHLLSSYRVTHLVCDCNLGPGLPLGIDLVPEWRRSHASIERAVIFSGTDLGPRPIPDEVDAIIEKGADPQLLVAALGLAEQAVF